MNLIFLDSHSRIVFRAGGHDTGDELKRTGRFCGGLIDDIKRKAPFIINGSDFLDGLNLQARFE